MNIFTLIFTQPLFNLLVVLYLPFKDLGAAIILLTLIIRLIFWPLSHKASLSQKALTHIQPKINELREKYKGQNDKLAPELKKLYKSEGVNPASSCLPILVQLPFLFAIYKVFADGLGSKNLDLVYSFVPKFDHLNTLAFGFLPLDQKSIVLAAVAAILQLAQSLMMQSKNKSGVVDAQAAMQKSMVYMFPALTFFIAMSLPSGLALYWAVTTLLSVVQQFFVNKKFKLRNAPVN